MNDQARAILITKLGTLMMANAELATENMLLAQRGQEQVIEIAGLKARVAELEKQSVEAGGTDGAPELMATAGAGGLPAGVGSGGGDTKTH